MLANQAAGVPYLALAGRYLAGVMRDESWAKNAHETRQNQQVRFESIQFRNDSMIE